MTPITDKITSVPLLNFGLFMCRCVCVYVFVRNTRLFDFYSSRCSPVDPGRNLKIYAPHLVSPTSD